jgi:ribokinase
MTNELEDAVNIAAIDAAPDGARLVLDPAPARRLPPEILVSAPVLTPNADEAEALTGQADPERAARALQSLTSAPVVVTLGAQGALLLNDGTATRFEAPVVAAVVDTTGAGDTLAGALAAALAAGCTIEQSVEMAVEAAAKSVQVAGAGWDLGSG